MRYDLKTPHALQNKVVDFICNLPIFGVPEEKQRKVMIRIFTVIVLYALAQAIRYFIMIS